MGFLRFSVFRCCSRGVRTWPLVVISGCLPTVFSTEISSLLIVSEVPVPLTPVVPSLVVLRGIVSFIPVSVIAFPVSFVALVLVGITSSVVISISTLRSVVVIPPESLFFRVLTVARLYVPNWCCLPAEQVVLASVRCMCT